MRSGSCVVFNGTRAGNCIPQRLVPAVYLNPCNLPNLAFLACIKINKLRRINRAYGFESHPRLQIFHFVLNEVQCPNSPVV
jgi:hypothetical protein